MKFPVFSLLAGNLASETSSLLTAPSSSESAANSSRREHRADFVKLRDGGRVPGRDEIFADLRITGGSNAAGSVDVLEPERYSVQRAAIVVACHDLALRRFGLFARLLRRRQEERVELLIGWIYRRWRKCAYSWASLERRSKRWRGCSQ